MRKIFFTVLMILAIFETNAQITADCQPPSSATLININNKTSATLGNGGEILYSKLSPALPSYYVLTDNNFLGATIYNSSLWLGGVDESSGDLKLAAMTYRQAGNDFWPGPIENSSQTTDSLQCNNYNRHWFMDQVTIDKFKNGEALSAYEDSLLLEWPGKGNPHLNFNHLNQVMAPFYDVDGDEIYNPRNGDFPKIKGDKAIWWIINDVGNEHTESGGAAFGFEIHKMFYVFEDDPELAYTPFFDVKITNKSSNNYEDFIFGHRVDMDLGNYLDDYVGCDTLSAMGYTYNADAYDDTAEGFGENAPLQACQFINVPDEYYDNQNDLFGFTYYTNDFNNTGNPEMTEHFLNYLNGKWKNGDVMTNGGNATDQNLKPTRYIYPENPSNGDAWSECSTRNEPSDRTFIISSGKYKFAVGETKTWTLALHTIPDVGGVCPDVQPLIDKAEYAKTFFENFVLVDVKDNFESEKTLVYPNPAKNKLYFKTNPSVKIVEIYSVDGQLILQKNINSNSLNIEDLSKGLYYVKLFCNDGKVHQSRFIIK